MRNQRWDEMLLEIEEAVTQLDKAMLRHESRTNKRRNTFSRPPQRRKETLFNELFEPRSE